MGLAGRKVAEIINSNPEDFKLSGSGLRLIGRGMDIWMGVSPDGVQVNRFGKAFDDEGKEAIYEACKRWCEWNAARQMYSMTPGPSGYPNLERLEVAIDLLLENDFDDIAAHLRAVGSINAPEPIEVTYIDETGREVVRKGFVERLKEIAGL